MTNSLNELKARIRQCNLESESTRSLMRSHLLTEKGRLGEERAGLGGCLDAAALLVESAGQVGSTESREIQVLLLRLVEMVAQSQEREAEGETQELPHVATSPTGVGVLNHMALGEVIIQLGLVPRGVVERALQEATRHGRSLGEVLVAVGAVTPEDLEQAEALHRRLTTHGAAPGSPGSPGADGAEEPVDPASAVHRILLGELLIAQGAIERNELNRALAHQKVSGQRLGEALVELGILDELTVCRAVESQARQPRD